MGSLAEVAPPFVGIAHRVSLRATGRGGPRAPAGDSRVSPLRPGLGRARALTFALLLLAFVGCDHATKGIAQSALAGAGPVSLAAGTVRLELVHNPGAFLSAGAMLPAWLRHGIFLGAVPLVIAGLCGVMLRSGPRSALSLLGLSLVAGGGLANWLDRLLHAGLVRDFVSLGVGALRTGVFNAADVFIVAGVVLLLLSWNRGEVAPT